MKTNTQANFIWIVSFFLFSGYYVGLSFFYVSNMTNLTRFYTIPLRLILCVIMIYVIMKNRYSVKLNKVIHVSLFLFSALYIAKIMYTEAINWSTSLTWFEYIFYYISFAVLPFLFFSHIDFKKFKGTIINALIFSGFLLGLVSIFIFKDILISGGVGRISQLSYETEESVISPLALAYSGALTIVLCLYKLLYENNTKMTKIYVITTMIFSFILFFLGSTRGALIAILISLLVFLYFGNIRNKLRFLFLFTLAIPLVIYGIEVTGSSIFERSLSTVETGDSSGREPLWNAAIDEFLKYPILGGRIEVSGVYPHNVFLEVLMATGLAGFIFFIIILSKAVKKGFFKVKAENIYLIPFLIFICAFSQHMFSGALYGATLLFMSLGMFSKK